MAQRVTAIAAGAAPELVWLLEHPPLYTAGTSAKPEDLLAPARFPVHRTGRGGQFTYHGPGQRVAYVMLDVKRRFGDVRAYVAALEDWVIDALAALGVQRRTAAGPRRRLGAPRGPAADAAGPTTRSPPSACGCALGELARLQPQRRAGPRALRRHRAVRHPRRRRHQPRRSWAGSLSLTEVDGALRAAFEQRFGATVDVARARRGGRRCRSLRSQVPQNESAPLPGGPGSWRASPERPS